LEELLVAANPRFLYATHNSASLERLYARSLFRHGAPQNAMAQSYGEYAERVPMTVAPNNSPLVLHQKMPSEPID
jgi:hypothetical protein